MAALISFLTKMALIEEDYKLFKASRLFTNSMMFHAKTYT